MVLLLVSICLRMGYSRWEKPTASKHGRRSNAAGMFRLRGRRPAARLNAGTQLHD